MIVRARHPVPAWLVPRGARTPRLGFVEGASVVRIPEVGLGEMRRGPGQWDADPLCEHGGRTWVAATDPDGRPLTGERLSGLLEGPLAQGGRRVLSDLLRRSPLQPAASDGPDAAEARAGARILAVAPGCGPDAVGRWVSENLLLAGGTVHVRHRPVLAFRPAGAGAAVLETRLCHGDWLSRLPAARPGESPDRELSWFAFAPGMASEAIRFADEGAGIRVTSEAVDRPGTGAEDIAAQAGLLPERVWAEARRVLAAHAHRPVGDPAAAAAVADRAEAMLPHVLDGIAGCVAPAAAGAVLERCLALSRAIQDLAGPLWSVTRLPLIDRYVTERALPGLAYRDSPHDIEALAGLVP